MRAKLLSLALFAALSGGEAPLKEARSLLGKQRHAEAERLLGDWIAANGGTPEVYELRAQALAGLGQPDRAAHEFALALEGLEASGRGGDRLAGLVQGRLAGEDPLARRRDELCRQMAQGFGEIAEDLLREGHAARALELLERARPLATERVREELELLLAKARAAFEEVDLDGAGDGGSDAGPIELESEHYVLVCDLEEEVTRLVADTMDDIFSYYVLVYFDGEEGRASKRKATIRLHADHASMMREWPEPGRSVGGWWSPGEWTVHAYDTRQDTGSLDQMLETLFHEASHQFMTMLAGGGNTPSWINEGTASFFEGARAMADRRVLWPVAARARLLSLVSMLSTGSGPSVRDVIAYEEPSSYPGEYYPFGWGLVFYLQQYEDPQTLAYAWRPYYQRYREEIVKRGSGSLALFEEIFLGAGNPGGFASLDGFVTAWKDWIVGEVLPLAQGPERRALRRTRFDRYLAAAAAAAQAQGTKAAKEALVSEEALLLRALEQAEVIRSEIDREEHPDGQLLLLEADVLERLGRQAAAAAAIERALELEGRGKLELGAERVAALQERMAALDRRNAPLRQLRLRTAAFTKRARALLQEYDESAEPFPLRTYTFALKAGRALGDAEVLQPAAARLQEKLLDEGLAIGRFVPVDGANWETIFTAQESEFAHGPGWLRLAVPARYAGRICTDLELRAPYGVRCRLRRGGEVHRSSFYGVVVAGHRQEDWYAVGVAALDELAVVRCSRDSSGVPTTRSHRSIAVTPPIAADEEPVLHVRVDPAGVLEIRILGDVPRATQRVELQGPVPARNHLGILVKDGRLDLAELLVEVFP